MNIMCEVSLLGLLRGQKCHEAPLRSGSSGSEGFQFLHHPSHRLAAFHGGSVQ